jgi:[ribosomal protein S5]-alanine N-acetyltransferase
MPVFMESERLWYRAPEKADAPLLTRYLQDPEVRRNLLIGRFPFSVDNELHWIEQRHSGPPVMEGATDVGFLFGPLGTDTLIGGTGLHRISWLHRHAEWGIFIGDTAQWGKGYGREVARAMLRYAFQTLNLHRVFLRVNADNERGVRAYEAAGYRREGVMRQAVFVDGAYVDQVVMSVLRPEWAVAGDS